MAVVIKARSEVELQAGRQLRTAADTAREVLKFRGNQLTNAVDVLTADFGFKEAIASGDMPTLISAIGNYRSRIGADVVIVMDSAGRPLASSLESMSARTRSDLQSLVAKDGDDQQLRLYRLIDGRPYQLVLSPVLAPDPVGWTAMGFALDDKVAADMARLLGVDVSFVAGAGPAALVAGSSLDAATRNRLAPAAAHTAGIPFSVRSDGDEYLTWTNPIRSANGALTLVLQRSLESARRPYLQLRAWIAAIGLAILAVACVLAALLARSATRPVDDLTRAAERLEAGDYGVPVPTAGTTELSHLSSAFNAMRGAVAERERIIRHQAMHDALTGLPTRAHMAELLDGMIAAPDRKGRPLTAGIVEILQLHNIVGSFGHAAADGVLREAARRLASGEQLPEGVARIGSDQFLVILDGVGASRAVTAGERIAERLRAPFDYAGVSLQLEARIGVAVYPGDGNCAADLLQRADLARFRAAEAGLSVGAFVRGDDDLQRRRLAILGDLRRAIGADELELHYQPKVSLRTAGVVGCEALVRWRHPQKGLIPPVEFIGYAEQTGLIRVVTTWVLGSAFRQLRAWQAAGLTLDMSVNVSAADLADAGFAQSVVSLIAQSGVDPAHVLLEVTETGAMKDLGHTLRIMEELRVLGIRFSIDDFGTGYSSLAHLKRLPVDEIKIDRSFVRELETRQSDDVILRSTIALGHALDLKVVAEGVEVAAGWEALGRFGCDLVQGYFVSKPLPAREFTAWVNARLAEPRQNGIPQSQAETPPGSPSERRIGQV